MLTVSSLFDNKIQIHRFKSDGGFRITKQLLINICLE